MAVKGACRRAGVPTGGPRSGVYEKIVCGVEPLPDAVEGDRCVEHRASPDYTSLLRPSEQRREGRRGKNHTRFSGLYGVRYIPMVRYFVLRYDSPPPLAGTRLAHCA